MGQQELHCRFLFAGAAGATPSSPQGIQAVGLA
jgi:hypothetical protein